MSKICIKCGNVIPDGMDVCPNCGREEYDDSNLQNVLNELGLDMDENQNQSEKADSSVEEDEPTIRLPQVGADSDADKKDAEDTDSEETAEASETEDTIEAILGGAMKSMEPAKKEKSVKKQATKKRPEKKEKGKSADGAPKRTGAVQEEEETQKNSGGGNWRCDRLDYCAACDWLRCGIYAV